MSEKLGAGVGDFFLTSATTTVNNANASRHEQGDKFHELNSNYMPTCLSTASTDRSPNMHSDEMKQLFGGKTESSGSNE